jgi:RNA polymerase sigma-70 factor, ECF subfamily
VATCEPDKGNLTLSNEITEILTRWNAGDPGALDQLAPLIYAELHRLAAGYLRNEREGHTLQTTALVHEAYLAVRKLDRIEWKNRSHFVAISAQSMRLILVDHARRRIAKKRNGERHGVSLEEASGALPGPDLNLVALDQVLDRFSNEFPRQSRVVTLRFFGGLTSEEVVDVLHESDSATSLRTVERDWRFARAWLHRAMVGVDARAVFPGDES